MHTTTYMRAVARSRNSKRITYWKLGARILADMPLKVKERLDIP